jgi:hypothetical protein
VECEKVLRLWRQSVLRLRTAAENITCALKISCPHRLQQRVLAAPCPSTTTSVEESAQSEQPGARVEGKERKAEVGDCGAEIGAESVQLKNKPLAYLPWFFSARSHTGSRKHSASTAIRGSLRSSSHDHDDDDDDDEEAAAYPKP